MLVVAAHRMLVFVSPKRIEPKITQSHAHNFQNYNTKLIKFLAEYETGYHALQSPIVLQYFAAENRLQNRCKKTHTEAAPKICKICVFGQQFSVSRGMLITGCLYLQNAAGFLFQHHLSYLTNGRIPGELPSSCYGPAMSTIAPRRRRPAAYRFAVLSAVIFPLNRLLIRFSCSASVCRTYRSQILKST